MPPKEEGSAWFKVPENRRHKHQARVVQRLLIARRKSDKMCIRSSLLQCVGPPWPADLLCSQPGDRIISLQAAVGGSQPLPLRVQIQKAGGVPDGHWHTSLSRTKEYIYIKLRTGKGSHKAKSPARAVLAFYVLVRKCSRTTAHSYAAEQGLADCMYMTAFPNTHTHTHI